MYISKKKKLIIGVSVPAALLVVGTAITVPSIVISEQNKNSKLNTSPNLVPTLMSNDDIQMQLPNFPYNVNQYTQSFFVNKIANQKYTFFGRTVKTNQMIFNLPRIYNSVNYEVINVYEDSNRNLKATIKKSIGSKTSTYDVNISVPLNYFETDVDTSMQNFVDNTSKQLKELIKTGYIQINQTSTSSNIEDISQQDLVLDTYNGFDVSLAKDENNSLYYAVANQTSFESSIFWYLNDYPIEFNAIAELNGERTIWNSEQAYPVNSEGKFDSSTSSAYALLSSMSDKLLLPELTLDESSGLDENEILNKRIEKFIFNPSEDPKILNSLGQNVPNPSYQAVLVKITLKTWDNQDTGIEKYILVWQDLIATVNKSILESAPEISYRTQKTLNGLGEMAWPTAEQLKDKTNWDLLVPVDTPKKGFTYTVVNVEIPEESQDIQDKIDVTIRITYTGIEDYRDYVTRISSGITSLPQANLDQNIYDFLKTQNDPTNVTAITPTIQIDQGALEQNKITNVYDLRDKLNSFISSKNYDQFAEMIKVTLPSSLPTNLKDIIYIPTLVIANQNKIEIQYVISVKVNETIISSSYSVYASTTLSN